MSEVKKILCSCLGNSDRSPVMRAQLELMLRNQGTEGIEIISAGVLDSAKSGGGAPDLSISIAPTYGIDLSTHRKQHISSLDLGSFDLVIAADKEVQAELMGAGVKAEIICLELNGASNAWKAQNPRKVEDMFHSIHNALLREVISYKFRK